jgi:hypothetical protein
LDSWPLAPAVTISIAMDVVTIMRALERAQAYAYPGREAAERDSVLRQLWRELQRPPTGDVPQLRLVASS